MSTAQEVGVLEKIRLRGHWRVAIRPGSFQRDRITDRSDLFTIVEKNSVRFRGWDYPHIDYRNQPQIGVDWVGQECEWEDQIELWRLYQSGQFIHFLAISGDWRDRSTIWTREPGWRHGQFLYYLDAIYTILEVFEFAARLALSSAGAPVMVVQIDLKGLQGRRLTTTDSSIALRGEYRTQSPEWNYRWEGSQTALIAEPRELAVTAARNLFAGFGLNVTDEVLRRLQERVGR
jgi:hypothetical protein